ncbi:hypothetical protein PybrP1_003860 [[Pythium] brassicae (nom. inval.)]|nr:hypothetical protein PybrP1_003860 [[Pythium] brassicae (nom. inval.)]
MHGLIVIGSRAPAGLLLSAHRNILLGGRSVGSAPWLQRGLWQRSNVCTSARRGGASSASTRRGTTSDANERHAIDGESDKKRAVPTGSSSASEEDLSDIWRNPVPHPKYDLREVPKSFQQLHHEPVKLHEKAALAAVRVLRRGFDLVSRYRGPGGAMTEHDWLNRCLFLESIAGVPGMVAGMTRHLHSIRAMRRDYGWIHTLLEEAENERMHLLIFMNMKQPGWVLRSAVLGAQGVFFNAFFLTYLVSPRTCHRFVGYLEEEAVKTYTGLLQDIEGGHLKNWERQVAPRIARNYYDLPSDAKIADMIKCIRADEANHRDVNHAFAGLDQKRGVNPFVRKGERVDD